MNKYLVFISLISFIACSIRNQAHLTFNQEALNLHNKYRQLHQVGNLTLNVDYIDSAQKYADELAKSCVENPKHSGSRNSIGALIGENLYTIQGLAPTAAAAVNSWYREETTYDYTLDAQPGKGHFSQLVWKDSKKFGVGISKCQSKNINYVVAHYYPSGNWQGEFAQNVFPKPGGHITPKTTKNENISEFPEGYIGGLKFKLEEKLTFGRTTSSVYYKDDNTGLVQISGSYDMVEPQIRNYVKATFYYPADKKGYTMEDFLNKYGPSNKEYSVQFAFTVFTQKTTDSLYMALVGKGVFE